MGRLGVILAGVVLTAACQRVPLGGGAGGTDGSSDGAGNTGSSSSSSSSSSSGSSSSSSGGSSSSDDSSWSSQDGGAFIEEPDLDYDPCDPVEQDCPEGEKCTSYTTEPGYCCVDANKCVPIIGERQLGEACDRTFETDDCGRGLFCLVPVADGATGLGVCMEYCGVYEIPEGCGPGRVCTYWADGVLPLCYDPCDPLADDCPPLLGCFRRQDWMLCQPHGAVGLGEPCGLEGCQPGLVCVNSELVTDCPSTACCTPYCDLNDPGPGDPCDVLFPGHVCQPADDWLPPGYDHVGICGLP